MFTLPDDWWLYYGQINVKHEKYAYTVYGGVVDMTRKQIDWATAVDKESKYVLESFLLDRETSGTMPGEWIDFAHITNIDQILFQKQLQDILK